MFLSFLESNHFAIVVIFFGLFLFITGDVDRDEWRETIEFYLELKKEEKEMHEEQASQVDFMKKLREKKLAALGNGGNKKPPVPAPILEEEDESHHKPSENTVEVPKTNEVVIAASPNKSTGGHSDEDVGLSI